MRIRDPIHGAIPLSDAEVALLDDPLFQRLRHVKQLGFGEFAFPGATHTRHAHSLGAMHMAARLFDAATQSAPLDVQDRSRLRRVVRAAAMLHDVGHMPMSHASERIAPCVDLLGLPAWVGAEAGSQASHEDFTCKLVLDSSLSRALDVALAGTGFEASAVVSLVTGREPPGGSPFVCGGRDFAPMLRQLVSGELDADRMDYLARDAFYAGVKYGQVDIDWLVQNLWPAELEGRIHLALSKAAVFAFEDFLLSRFHMFVSVYLQHTSVCFDELLRRWYADVPGEFEIPATPEGFLHCDDVALWTALRASKSPWAKRLVERRGFKLLAQVTPRDRGYDLDGAEAALAAAGIETMRLASTGTLSRYFQPGSSKGGPGLYVVDRALDRLTPITDYSPLYQRHGEALTLDRLYVDDARRDEARELLKRRGWGRPEGSPQ